MALFLGTYNVPTNKKLRVNNTLVTEVYSNSVLVWKYVVQVTPGGLPMPGAKGSWSNTGKTLLVSHGRHADGSVTTVSQPTLGYGEKKGGLTGSRPDNGKTPTSWFEKYAILKWVPAP